MSQIHTTVEENKDFLVRIVKVEDVNNGNISFSIYERDPENGKDFCITSGIKEAQEARAYLDDHYYTFSDYNDFLENGGLTFSEWRRENKKEMFEKGEINEDEFAEFEEEGMKENLKDLTGDIEKILERNKIYQNKFETFERDFDEKINNTKNPLRKASLQISKSIAEGIIKKNNPKQSKYKDQLELISGDRGGIEYPVYSAIDNEVIDVEGFLSLDNGEFGFTLSVNCYREQEDGIIMFMIENTGKELSESGFTYDYTFKEIDEEKSEFLINIKHGDISGDSNGIIADKKYDKLSEAGNILKKLIDKIYYR